MKKYFPLLVLAFLFSCDKDRPDLGSSGLDPLGTTFVDPTGLEMWIDGDVQEVRLFRVRKANGASRMRLLVDMPDSVRFTLFVTPFAVGSHQIESGNVLDEALKFSRTHSEFQQSVNESQSHFYEVNTVLAADNRVEIFQIDTVHRIVAGRFSCQMKNLSFAGSPVPENIRIWGNFHAIYQD